MNLKLNQRVRFKGEDDMWGTGVVQRIFPHAGATLFVINGYFYSSAATGDTPIHDDYLSYPMSWIRSDVLKTSLVKE